jgi:hypothetical protein
MRPNLVKLANETDDNDESLADIIKTNEHCEKIIGQYKFTFLKEMNEKISDDVKLVNIVMESEDDDLAGSRSVSGRGGNVSGQTSRNYDPLSELQDLFSSNPVASSSNKSDNSYHQSPLNSSSNFNPYASSLIGENSLVNNATNNIETLLSSINIHQQQQQQNNEAKLNQNSNKATGLNVDTKSMPTLI